jgi:hypothetical protein
MLYWAYFAGIMLYENREFSIEYQFGNIFMSIVWYLFFSTAATIFYYTATIILQRAAIIKKHIKKLKLSQNLRDDFFTIYDNESTDNSVEIANQLSCNVVSWNSNNIQDDYKFAYIKNNVWKDILSGWVIIADMDEWLCITEDELCEEEKNGTTIINTQGIDIIGESKILDLTDVDLHSINKYVDNPLESKKICFFYFLLLKSKKKNSAQR